MRDAEAKAAKADADLRASKQREVALGANLASVSKRLEKGTQAAEGQAKLIQSDEHTKAAEAQAAACDAQLCSALSLLEESVRAERARAGAQAAEQYKASEECKREKVNFLVPNFIKGLDHCRFLNVNRTV